MPAGTHRLVLTHDKLPKATFGPFQVDRGPGELEVQPIMIAGVALRGRVVGFENAAGWTVTAQSRKTYSSTRAEVQSDLSFAILGLAPGSYEVSVRNPSNHS